MDFNSKFAQALCASPERRFWGCPRAMADALSAASEQIHVAQAAHYLSSRAELSDKMRRPGRGAHACLKAWPNDNHGDPSMVEVSSSLSDRWTKYWVEVILTTAWECRRFDCEREALAWAQVCARCPTLKRWWRTPTDPRGRRSSSIGAKHSNHTEQRGRANDPARRQQTRTHTRRGEYHIYPNRVRDAGRFAVILLAKRESRKAVIRQLKAEGHRPSLMSVFRNQHAG